MRRIPMSVLAISCLLSAPAAASLAGEYANLGNSHLIAGDDGARRLPIGVEAGWWSTVQEKIRQEEYLLVRPDGRDRNGLAESFQATNRAHGFRTTFTADGILVAPRSGATPSWEWGLSAIAWGRQGAIESLTSGSPSAVENRFELHRPGLVEWFANGPSGLAQGFTVAEPPAGGPSGSGRGEFPFALDLALRGTLHPVVSPDGQAVDFALPSGGMKVLRYAALAVTDATGKALPARFAGFAERGGGVRILLNDVSAAYPLTIRSLTTSAAWTFEGDQAEAWLGSAVATAGDVNGDGFSDALVGAFFYDTAAGADAGKVWLFPGSASGLESTAAWTFESDQATARLGFSVASAGDVNGDGYADVAIGATFYDAPLGDEGKAWVFHGSATGLAASPAWTGRSGIGGANYGNAIASAGDVNGDGYSDLIVGAPEANLGIPREGTIYVYLGSSSGLGTSAAWSARGNGNMCWLGSSVATAGDLNGDGYSDIAAGGNGYQGSIFFEGGVFVWYGSASGLGPSGTPANAAWSVRSGQGSWPRFGARLDAAGDVNGDGYADLMVSAWDYDGSFTNEGKAWVFHGSATGLSCGAGCPVIAEAVANWSAVGGQTSAAFGGSVAAAGDVNGDGYADILVGAVAFDVTAPGSDEGKAYLYLGSATGLAASPAWTAEGSHPSEIFGIVAGAGDVDGNGFADVLVGSQYYTNGQTHEGRASLFLGGPDGLSPASSWSALGEGATFGFGVSVASAGDVNGDGYGDVIAGDYQVGGTGKAYLFLGGANGLSADPAWTATGESPNDGFGSPVTTAGDVNADGYADVVVGAPGYSLGTGKAYLYFGGSTGLSPAPSWTALGERPNSYFGTAAATAGDVNGDGYSDVVVGAGQRNTMYAGTAYLYLGGPTGLSTTWAWTATGEGSNHRFAESVATAGDVNGDGYSDVIVGADYFQNIRGKAYLYLGGPAGLSLTPDWSAVGENVTVEPNYDAFGWAVGTAGDVNGDGYSDVVVSAIYINSVAGKTYLYLGSPAGLSTTASWTATGEAASNYFGIAVGTAGDVNGDGYSDVVVGANGVPTGQNRGKAYLYLGGSTGLAPVAAWTAVGENAGDQFAYSAATAGDVNGDGYADVVVGAYYHAPSAGKAYGFLGGGGGGVPLLPRQLQADGATPIAPLGRTSSDLFRTNLMGKTPFGRGRVRLEYEVKPLGQPLNGIGTSSTIGWSDTGVAGTPLSGLAAVSPSGPHHWRARLRYSALSMPWMPGSRWVSIPGNGPQETDLRVIADFTAPANPSALAAQAPHAESGWSNQTTITMVWSGAADEPGGSGLAGYSVLFDNAATTLPDVSVEVAQLADPHSVTSLSFGNGAWYFHLRTCDVAGNCGPALHRGPYGIDSTLPSGLSVLSPSHAIWTWSNDASIDFTFSGATDPTGIAGYAVEFDRNADTAPACELDQAGTVFTGSCSPDAADWWIHVRAVDAAGNCGATVHLGPFEIDTTLPSAASGLASSSHTVSVPSNDNTIDVSWTAATDGLSAIDGYGLAFDHNAGWTCDEVQDVEESELSTTSAMLDDGEWHFHLCARDNAGNWGPVASIGPFVVDTAGAAVAAIGSVADSGDGELTEGESTEGGVTQLIVVFNGAMFDAAGDSDPADVTNPSNYHLYQAGPNRTLQTATCGAAAGDDVEIPVAAASYDAVTTTAALAFPGSFALSRESYRLLVCPTLEDDAGTAIALFTRNFAISTTDLLSNPNLDSDLSAWVVTEPVPGAILWSSAVDAGEAATSGSAELLTATGSGQTFALSQCVEAPAGPFLEQARARITGTSATAPVATVRLDFFDAASCGGTLLDSELSDALGGDTGGIWQPLEVRRSTAPALALSVLVTARIEGGSEASFTVHLDDLLFGHPPVFFTDGFESGDLSAWSASVP